jgi:glycosyltransferase 2 family protein
MFQKPAHRFNLILIIIAAVFLILMLRKLDWSSLGEYLLQVGYYGPLLLLPYGLVNYLGAASWNYLLPNRETCPSMSRLFSLRLAGESLNQLTPTASMGGEPFKVIRLKALGVAWEEATASVVIQKGITVLSLVLYVFLGLTLAVSILKVSPTNLGLLGLTALGLGIAGMTFLIVQRRGPCVLGIRLLEKCGMCPAVLKAREDELACLDSCLAGFYQQYPVRGLIAFLLFFLSWLCHGCEVYLIFRLLGHPVDLGMALCMDALVMLFAASGFMIPASAGVQDGGAILVSLGLNLGATLGAAFAILRRLREASWLLLGLLLAYREK